MLGWFWWNRKTRENTELLDPVVALEEPVEVDESPPPPPPPILDSASHLSDRVVHNVSIQNEGESRPFVSSLEKQYRCIRAGEEPRPNLWMSEAAKLRGEGWQCEDMLYRGPLDTTMLAKLEEAEDVVATRRIPEAIVNPTPVAPAPSMSGWESHGKRNPFVALSA